MPRKLRKMLGGVNSSSVVALRELIDTQSKDTIRKWCLDYADQRQFSVAISEKQQQTTSFRIGDEASGTGWTKKYPKWEYAEYYRAGALKRVKQNDEPYDDKFPPWLGNLPDMETYEQRGCRVLSKACWKGKCFKCKWATMANVTIEYNWGVTQKWRFESFCYGPKSCKLYKRGADPMIPYKGYGSTPDSHGGFDEILTENREWDE